jgi:hypothetical protein
LDTAATAGAVAIFGAELVQGHADAGAGPIVVLALVEYYAACAVSATAGCKQPAAAGSGSGGGVRDQKCALLTSSQPTLVCQHAEDPRAV